MPGCVVSSCRNWNGNCKNKNIKFFQSPKDPELAKQWIEACNLINASLNLKNARICSVHFAEECFADTSHLLIPGQPPVLKLKANSIPTKNLSESLPAKRNLSQVNDSLDKVPAKKKTKLETTTKLINLDIDKFGQSSKANDSLVRDEVPATEQLTLPSKNKLTNLDVDNESTLKENERPESENNINTNEKNSGMEIDKLSRIDCKEIEKIVEQKVTEILSPIFTNGQIKKLLNPNKKKIKWLAEDIANAISLRSVSPKAFRYLRNKGFPLPALSTLRLAASRVNVEEGVIRDILKSMSIKAKDLSFIDKVCVLCFDEIYVSQEIEIEKKEEKRVGPFKAVQVGMARGLFSRWKQPVYFAYDKPLTQIIITEVIEQLYAAGYHVVAITTDLGPTNFKIWSTLNVGIESHQNCFFVHPCDSSAKIFVFADPPHLLKLMRNNYYVK